MVRAEDGEVSQWCSQHQCGEGVELVCAQRIRAGSAPAAESSCSREVPCQRGVISEGTASFPGLLSSYSWEGRHLWIWLMKGMKLVQEILGRHRRAHWQKRVTDGEKPAAGINESSGHHLAVPALPLFPEELLTLRDSGVIAASSPFLPKPSCWR